MKPQTSVTIQGVQCPVYAYNTLVIGSGAAGFNAADRVYALGQQDVALITNGIGRGTSRNTGSDKQTYYKLNMAGAEGDSVQDMAQMLFKGGAMDGDIALAEAASSARCFFRLVELGVPFPHNRYGEYVGYQTDHDTRTRATSVGPLTSRVMTERLEAEVRRKQIPIFDFYQVIAVLTHDGQAVGILALNTRGLTDPDKRYALFCATNIIYATGGPAGIYDASVYPASQAGATGAALEAGVFGKNVTESQYGLASTAFRWNVSGTYQQVLPRYISTAADGSDEREFLREYFDTPGQLLSAVFLKGYQWPFDPRKVAGHGSSLIDLLVYQEQVVKGRRVFLDYTQNMEWGRKADGSLDFTQLSEEAYRYLEASHALCGTPVERLRIMNEPAVQLYAAHRIDITRDHLEIAVCAQHNNGGLEGNCWWESNIRHFFPIGEVNGSHGIYRPGGTALNSGQVGGLRAAQYSTAMYKEAPPAPDQVVRQCEQQLAGKIALGNAWLQKLAAKETVTAMRCAARKRMSAYGAHVRHAAYIQQAVQEIRQEIQHMDTLIVLSSPYQLPAAFQHYDMLITQYTYLSAMLDYIEKGGDSRGSYLVYRADGDIPAEGMDERFTFRLDRGLYDRQIQRIQYQRDNVACRTMWRPVRPIPTENNWFETVWNQYRSGQIIQ